MSGADSQLARFVRALHRRHVVVRVAERAGLGLLGGCAAALMLVPVLLWRGHDAWGVAGAALAVGTLAGAAWGFVRRPTPMAAAAEADRQLGTADLLASAWAMRAAAIDDETKTDAWRRTVLALAAARCSTLSPSAVLLRRLGGRAWGGIALAVALVATLASFSSGPLRADDTSRQLADRRTTPPGSPDAARPIIQLASNGTSRQRRVEQNPGDERDRDRATADATDDHAAADPAEPGRPAEQSHQTAAAGTGDGSGRTKPDAIDAERRDPTPTDGSRIPRPNAGDKGAGGTGRAARDAGPGDDEAGGSLAGDEASPGAPPWAHRSWDSAAEAAGEAIRAGRVADEYHDLVRGYFERPSTAGSASGGN